MRMNQNLCLNRKRFAVGVDRWHLRVSRQNIRTNRAFSEEFKKKVEENALIIRGFFFSENLKIFDLDETADRESFRNR